MEEAKAKEEAKVKTKEEAKVKTKEEAKAKTKEEAKAKTEAEPKAKTEAEPEAEPNVKKEENILTVLSFLAELRERRRDVNAKLERLDAVGYGPNEWKFEIKEKVTTRYTVVRPNPRARALVVREPLIKASFKNVDELHLHQHAALNFLVSAAFAIYKEPDNVSIDGALSGDPSMLGIPVEGMCAGEVPGETVMRLIRPYCDTRRRENPNYSDGFVAEGIALNDIREIALGISREEMRPMREILIEHEAAMGSGAPDANPYKRLHPGDVVHVMANPFELNTLFERLPLAVTYSSELILELQMPEITVAPMAPAQMMINSGQSTSKLSIVNAFGGINERPAMDTAMGFFMASLICPGSVEFQINFDDIPKDDIYLRGLAAAAAKLLFSYSDIARWSSIAQSSVRTVENALVKCGIAAQIFEPVAPGAGGVFPLDGVVASPRANFERLEALRTTALGAGWRESGAMRFGVMPETCPYGACQNRQLYCTDLDDIHGLDDEDVNVAYANWTIRSATHALLNVMSRGRVVRTPMSGMDAVFEICANRIFRFFIAVNNYNRENWYSGLRLSEARAADLYPDDLETPVVCEIAGRTILYMLKSIDENSVGRRREPFQKQFALECGIMRDCIETMARENLFLETNERYGINPAHFTRKDRCAITHPKTGPLAKILAHIRTAGYSALIGNFWDVGLRLTLSDLYQRCVTMVVDNPLQFGISSSVILHPILMRARVDLLEMLVDRGEPYTNVFTPRDPPDEIQEVALEALQQLVINYSAKEQIAEMSLVTPVSLRIPAPLSVTTKSLGSADEYPIAIKYDSINRHNTVRVAITMAPRSIIVNPIDANALQRPDITLSGMPRLREVHIPPEEFASCVETLELWMRNITNHMVPAMMIASKNVMVVPMFERS